jgi:DNA-binding transcriptional MerR regulator
MSYRIKTVASLTGISTTTLRAWERRYDVVEPQRTDSGYRVYSDGDIATLTRVKTLVDRGYKAGEAIDLVRRRASGPSPADLSRDDLSDVRARLLEALLHLDRATAAEAFAGLVAIPFDRQLDELLLPLLGDVGRRWASAECTIAQEHFASAFVREKLVAMRDELAGQASDGPEAICAGAPGEQHELGLLAAAIHLGMRGWKVTYLGADLPVDQIEPVARERRPALLCTSVIRTRSRSECLSLAAAMRAVAPSETRVVLGGAGLAPALPRSPAPGLYLLRSISELFELTD